MATSAACTAGAIPDSQCRGSGSSRTRSPASTMCRTSLVIGLFVSLVACALERLPDACREQPPDRVRRRRIVAAAAVSAWGDVYVRRRFVEQIAHFETEDEA